MPIRCPFPDCPSHAPSATAGSIDPVADGVALCRTCGRLVFQCVSDACLELNRPFSRFCRHCGQTQHPMTGNTVDRRWEEVQRFDFDWRHGINSTSNHQPRSLPVAQTAIHNLSSVPGFRQQKVLIEWAFVDGLLAIHQGSGFIALLHPFGDLAANPQSASGWTRPEESLLQAQDFELPYRIEGDADACRPFTPLATPDRKAVIFSTPYAVYAVKLGSLPGWHFRAAPEATVLWCADPLLQTRLAAAPVVLTETAPRGRGPERLRTPPNRLGLLLHDSESKSYLWRVITLDPPRDLTAEGTAAADSPVSVPFPLSGWPAQILGFRDQHLVFATPAGHWLWSTTDARRGETSSLSDLQVPDAPSDILLDAEVVTRSTFSWRNQHLLRRHEFDYDRRDERTQQHFELCYTRFRQGKYVVERRNIWPGNPDGTRTAVPQQLFRDQTARPIGDCVSADDPSIREMLYIVDSAGVLYRRPITGGDPRPIGSVQTGRMTDVYGFRFHDPLLVIVRKDSIDDAQQEVELRSVRHPDHRAYATGLALRADPLPWSNFLFTCEGTKSGVCVVRREYPVETAEGRTVFSAHPAATPPKKP